MRHFVTPTIVNNKRSLLCASHYGSQADTVPIISLLGAIMPNTHKTVPIHQIENLSISKLFALLLSPPSDVIEIAARNELHRRGYSDDDIHITLKQ